MPTAAIGVAFGVLAKAAGWGVVAPVVASLIVYSGSAQFASVSVLAAGGSVAAAVLAAALVNARFMAMSLSVAPSLRGSRLRRSIESQAIVDTSWAVSNRGDGTFDRAVLIGMTIPQYVAWAGGTLVGVVLGDVLGDTDRFGLDVLFPAFFLILLVSEGGHSREAIGAALLGGAIALALMPIAPAGVPVIAACAVALIGLRRARSAARGDQSP